MKRSFLTELGLESEQVDKIMKAHGEAVNPLKEELEKVEQYKEQLKAKEDELKERDKQLEELSQKAKGNEELTSQIDELKKQNKETAEEYQAKLNAQAKEFAIKSKLSEAKARNPKAVMALLDSESIEYKDGEVKGIDEQLETLRESDSYLFGDDEPKGLKGRQPFPPKQDKTDGITKEDFKKMSYMDKVTLKNENPELYQTLKG